MEDKAVKPIIEPDLASKTAFRRGSLGKLKQIGLHAITGKAPDPVDPGGINKDVACRARALAAAITVDTRNIVEQRSFACRQPRADFNGKRAAIVSNKGDLDHGIETFAGRAINARGV